LIDTEPDDPEPDAVGADGAVGAAGAGTVGVGVEPEAAVVGVPAAGMVVRESGTVIDGDVGIVTVVVVWSVAAAAGRVEPTKLNTITAATAAQPAQRPRLVTRARRPVPGRDRPRIRGMAAVRPGGR